MQIIVRAHLSAVDFNVGSVPRRLSAIAVVSAVNFSAASKNFFSAVDFSAVDFSAALKHYYSSRYNWCSFETDGMPYLMAMYRNGSNPDLANAANSFSKSSGVRN